MRCTLHSPFQLVGKEQTADRKCEWRYLWRGRKAGREEVTVSDIICRRPVGKVRYICDICLPSQFSLHTGLEKEGGGMVHSKGGNCNYIAINPAMRNMGHWGKEMGRVRAKGLRSPGLQSLEK